MQKSVWITLFGNFMRSRIQQKQFYGTPWIWGWIQQKPFFRPPGSGGGSSKNSFTKFAEKLSGPLDLRPPPLSGPLDPGVDPAKTLEKYSENVSGPLFQAPFSCLNILSVPPFQYPFSCLNVLSTPFFSTPAIRLH